MRMRARFLLLLGLDVPSWAAIPLCLALTWITGRLFASMFGWT